MQALAHGLTSLRARPTTNAAALDGLRAAMCVWMIVFHTFFWQNSYMTEAEYEVLGQEWPIRLFIVPGYMAVDVFFTLTGYLLATPLFVKYAAGAAKRKVDAKEQTQTQTQTQTQQPAAGAVRVDVPDWFYRRFMRVTPVYAATLALYCLVLFADGAMPLSAAKAEGVHKLAEVHWPNATHVPNSCHLSAVNMLYLNQLLPFAGCMGYTWTLAVQFQAYLALPLAWNRWGARGLVWACVAGVALSLGLRTSAFIDMIPMVPKTTELGFFSFFWYTNTLTRMSPILLGIVAAYLSVCTNTVQYLRNNRVVTWVAWIAVLVLLYVSRLVPYELTLSIPQQSFWGIATSILLHPGGPLMALCMAFSILGIHHRLGVPGEWFQSVFNRSFWTPIAELSYLAYLWHPMVMQYTYTWFWSPMGTSLSHFALYSLSNLVVTFTIAFIMHVVVDGPCQYLLSRKQTDSATPSWVPVVRRLTYWYCCAIMTLSVLAHLGMIPFALFVPHPVQNPDPSAAVAAAAEASGASAAPAAAPQ